MHTCYVFKRFLLLLTACCFFQQGYSQGSDHITTIIGKVVDSATLKPLESVTLTLFADSNLVVKTAVTEPEGSFTLPGIRPSSYKLVLTMVGYQTREVVIITGAGTTDVGLVYMNSIITGLDAVSVRGRKQVIRQLSDRISYDVATDPDSKIYSVLEMLRKIPFVSLDGEDNILFKGGSNYRIFINGKPSGMVERNPKDILRSMPASTIESIEVITNPSSKYDAEGMAGIINIITTRKPGSGYKGSVNASQRSPIGGPGLGLSIAAQSGKVGISAIAGASKYIVPSTNNSLIRATGTFPFAKLTQLGQSRSTRRNGYLGADLGFQANDNHLLSAQINLNRSRSVGSTDQSSMLMHGSLLESYRLASSKLNEGSSFDGSLNYQISSKVHKKRLLTFSYRYYAFKDDFGDRVLLHDRVNYQVPGYQQMNHENFSEHALQADYVTTLRKINVETGLKVIVRKNTSDYSLLELEGNRPMLSDDYNYNQHVYSAYNTYELKVEKWNIRAGLRAEVTDIDAKFSSVNTAADQHYFHLIPSFIVSHNLSRNSILKLGLVQQISRPNIRRLNPFIDRSNPNLQTSGNPGLRPYTFNRLQLGYGLTGKLSLQTGLDYTFVKNIDFRIIMFDSALNVTRSTFENTGNGNAIDYSLSLSYVINPDWDVSLNSMVTYIKSSVGTGISKVNRQMFQYSSTLTSGYRFKKGWRISSSMNVISPSFRSPQEKTNRLLGSSLGVIKTFVKDKLWLSLLVNNPLNKYRGNVITTTSPLFNQVYTTWDYFRSFNISLNYSFGKMQGAIKKSKRSIKNDDIVN